MDDLKKILGKSTDFAEFMNNDVDLKDRIIHLFKPIDFETVSNAAKGIQLLATRSKEKPIHIYIGSFGGCPYASFWLYDFIRAQNDVEIYTYSCGATMSGGSIIYMAGDKRFMYKHSRLMLHSIASIAEGKLFIDMVPEVEECREIYKEMCQIYTKHSNQDYKTWYRWLKHEDKIFKSDKAKELGLTDEIIGN